MIRITLIHAIFDLLNLFITRVTKFIYTNEKDTISIEYNNLNIINQH